MEGTETPGRSRFMALLAMALSALPGIADRRPGDRAVLLRSVPAIGGVAPGLAPGRIAGAGQWGEDPWSLLPLAIALGLYVAGLILLWRKAGSGRGISLRHAAAFGAGWLILALALQSLLHFWGERIFSAHMVEHEIVMVVAAPLLVVSRPLIPFLWALPIAWRRKLGGMHRLRGFRPIWEGSTRPLTAWIVHAAVLWVWHIPVVFRAALASEAVHAAQHLCFLAAALLYWWSLLCRRDGADMQGASVISLFATSVQTALLGALLTVSTVAWYGTEPHSQRVCGLTPIEDQQLAGLIMWVPAGLAYVGVALVLVLRLFGRRNDGRRHGQQACHFILRISAREPQPYNLDRADCSDRGRRGCGSRGAGR